MADGTRGDGENGAKAAEEAALSARLRRLGTQLEDVGQRSRPTPDGGARGTANHSGLARGMRMSAEMVGGVVVGTGLGWMIDRFAGTSPWGLIVLFLLGFAGGILSVMRSAGVLPERRR